MKFSQRQGLATVKFEVQRDSIDKPLRNKLWSGIKLAFFDIMDETTYRRAQHSSIIQRLWIHFFERPVDEAPGRWDGVEQFVRSWFFSAEWYEIFDLLEFLFGVLDHEEGKTFSMLTNSFLEQELSAFRIVDGLATEITSDTEVEAVEKALEDADGLSSVRAHLREALRKFSDRKSPDYRNSIKESISAVESLCQRITANQSATLGQALKHLEDAGVALHPALREAWSCLYGWTNDDGGIRHALSDDTAQPTSAQAKYMLVSCSAFVSFLIEQAAEAGVSLSHD